MLTQEVPCVLATTWTRYRVWAITARQLKASLDRWRLWTLISAISGTIMVTLGQQLGSLTAGIGPWGALAGRAFGLSGAAAIALSAYFAREALSNESVQRWTKCRSTAESLKASTYLYRAGISPFDGTNRDEMLLDRTAAIESAGEGAELQVAKSDGTAVDLSPLDAQSYLQQRVNDQIGFYRRRSDEYQKKMKRLRQVVFWLGAVAVLFGVVASVKPLAAAWTAVIATVIAAVSSHIQSQHYQSLIAAYQSTARRLEILRDKWEACCHAEADRNSLIQSCEDTMALESSAWVTQWSQQKAPGQKAV